MILAKDRNLPLRMPSNRGQEEPGKHRLEKAPVKV